MLRGETAARVHLASNTLCDWLAPSRAFDRTLEELVGMLCGVAADPHGS